MATGKKYYWIKLRKDFMTSDTVDFLMGQKDGAQYVVLYQMLCLMCINTQGQLSRKIGEIIIPFDIDKIQRDCKYFSRDTVMVSLELFKKLNLIYEQDDGVFTISEFDNIVGSETDYAAQKRIQRKAGGQSPQPSPQIVHTEKEIRVRDIELDIRDKNLDKDIDKDKNNKEGAKAPRKKGAERYYTDELLNQTFLDFMNMRKTIKKPMTDRSIVLTMNKLKELSSVSGSMDNDLAIKILEQSIMNCWQGLFQLKENRYKNTDNSFNEWRDA